MKPHSFAIHFSLGAVTDTLAPCFVSLYDFPPFLVNSNYIQAYTSLPKAFSSYIAIKCNYLSEAVQPLDRHAVELASPVRPPLHEAIHKKASSVWEAECDPFILHRHRQMSSANTCVWY